MLLGLAMLLVQPLKAQDEELRSKHYGIETHTCTYPAPWVALPDTLETMLGEERQAYTIDGFYICSVEVTQDLWSMLMDYNPSAVKGDMLPVTHVSRTDIDSFCTKLNRITGARWRLPTLEEWLFAYHGGLFSEGYRYCGSNNPDFVAWHKGNSGGKPHPVQERVCNELQIYDMMGNVAEMVTDGDSILYVGGSFRDTFTRKGDNDEMIRQPQGAESCGFRLVWRQPQTFNHVGPKPKP